MGLSHFRTGGFFVYTFLPVHVYILQLHPLNQL